MKMLNSSELSNYLFVLDGYHTIGKKIEVTPELVGFFKDISSYGEYMINKHEVLASEVIKAGRESFEKHYKTHDVKYCSREDCDRLDSSLTENDGYIISDGISSNLINNEDEDFKAFYDLLDKTVLEVSPFDVPVYFTLGGSGLASSRYVGIPTIEHINRAIKCATGIYLPEFINDEIGPAYMHEVTHYQVPDGGCLNYQNSEVLPIFNELLAAYDIDASGDLLRRVMFYRLADIFRSAMILNDSNSNYSNVDILKASVYITSSFQAFKLFDQYVSGAEEERDTIINGVQKIFDGEGSVEGLLGKNGISYDNSLSNQYVKKYIC